MEYSYFITGTDTGVGKTWVTIALMRYFKGMGLSVVGMKPVAAGCERHNGQLVNEDALLLQENASIHLDYKQVNPYAFELPISPHLAAAENPVQLESIKQLYTQLNSKADVVLVEGAGGWLAPLNYKEDIADLAITLELPVILVVAIKLGCINHARLAFQSICQSNVHCAGWVAMCVDSAMNVQDENIKTISNKLSVPLLGVLPYCIEGDFDKLAKNFQTFDKW